MSSLRSSRKSPNTIPLPSSLDTDGTLADTLLVLSIYDQYPICLREDWNSGIGGGLWSTGLAMANYFCTTHFQAQLQWMQRRKRHVMTTDGVDPTLRVLELGSGNGFLSVCLVVAAMMRRGDHMGGSDMEDTSSFLAIDKDPIPVYITATDTADHLSLMTTTIESNLKRISRESAIHHGDALHLSQYVTVQEYVWGESTIESSLIPHTGFDLIIGSDLAYRDELYDPLIAALLQFYDNVSTPKKLLTILGVTMTDTKPVFFRKLIQAKFRYEKLADHLLQPEFRGSGSRQFGIFVIYR
jgi:hypothetical protein